MLCYRSCICYFDVIFHFLLARTDSLQGQATTKIQIKDPPLTASDFAPLLFPLLFLCSLSFSSFFLSPTLSPFPYPQGLSLVLPTYPTLLTHLLFPFSPLFNPPYFLLVFLCLTDPPPVSSPSRPSSPYGRFRSTSPLSHFHLFISTISTKVRLPFLSLIIYYFLPCHRIGLSVSVIGFSVTWARFDLLDFALPSAYAPKAE